MLADVCHTIVPVLVAAPQGRRSLVRDIFTTYDVLGAIPSPFASWNMKRSI